MIGRKISHYEIVGEIGSGGMGQVYLARDTQLNISRALKFIHPHLVADPESKQRFLREAQLAATLEHSHICSIHEVGETPNGRPFICMSYYEGQTLAELLKQGPLPLERVHEIGCAVARGLARAHQQGIFHRDIKPENILITNGGGVKIVDFGLAKLADRTQITTISQPLGTPSYMSPEQIHGASVDYRTDIWSLGAVLYEMATGSRPFAGAHPQAVFYSVLHEEPTVPTEHDPALPAALVRIVLRCLHKDPNERYESIDDLLEDLTPCIAATPRRRRGRSVWLWPLVAVLILAAGFWGLRQSTQPPLYTTELRVAVLPLENLAHPDLTPLVAGISGIAMDWLDEIADEQESMWVVSKRLVDYAELGDAADARDAFGVNRLVTGNLQRHADGHLLQLTMRDADSNERTKTLSLTLDIESPSALIDSLPLALADLAGAELVVPSGLRRRLPAGAPNAALFLRAIGVPANDESGEAVTLLRQVVNAEPGFAGGAEALGWACWNRYLADGRTADLDSAFTMLARATELAPDDWRPLYRQGEINRLLGNIDEALDAFDDAGQLNPGRPLVCGRQARALLAQDRRGEAEATLSETILKWPDYFETHRLLGRHLMRIDENEAAFECLQRSAALAPGDAFTHQLLGAVFYAEGNFESARIHFDRAFRLRPRFLNCSNVGLMLYSEGKYREAASYYELALEFPEGVEDPKSWGNLATALYWSPDGRAESIQTFHRAIELAEAALAETPDDTRLIGHLIDYNAMAGNPERTRELIAQYEKRAAGDKTLLYAIGCACELLGDRSAALRYLGEALRQGFPAETMRATRDLADLVEDPVFLRMIEEKDGPAAGATEAR